MGLNLHSTNDFFFEKEEDNNIYLISWGNFLKEMSIVKDLNIKGKDAGINIKYLVEIKLNNK